MTVFRTLLGVLAAVLFGLIALALRPSPETTATPRPQLALTGGAPTIVPTLPTSTAAAVLERSPLDPERRAFVRGQPAAAIPVTVDVRITGISSRGDERRASLAINGEFLTVGVGEQTIAGVVLAIESDAVVLAGSPPRRVVFQ